VKTIHSDEKLWRLVRRNGEITAGFEMKPESMIIARPDNQDRIWLAVIRTISPLNEKVLLTSDH
jgi:hypothetical protein